MSQFLVFTLYAPLASWGDTAVGESRGSWDRPSRSAVLGLVAGALGVERDRQAELDGIEAGYGMAVRVDAVGMRLNDYHTTQTVAESDRKRAQRGRPALSRAALFAACPDRKTMLSTRVYLQDSCATVVLWARRGAPVALGALRNALQRPHFVPYAGRKSNVLGLPLDPSVVVAETLAAALSARPVIPAGLPAPPSILRAAFEAEAWEVSHDDSCEADGVVSGLTPMRREARRDRSVHRGRWQFGVRTMVTSLWVRPVAAETSVDSISAATPS